MGGILRNKLGGVIFMFILFFTSFFGSMLMMGPLVPIMFIHPHVYRRINDNLMALWLTLPVLLLEIFFGVKCKVTGDRLSKSERSVIIMNHRTRLDWMFFWKPLFSQSSVRSEKIILKDDLKHIPGPGWAMQIACYVFLMRKWDKDEKHMKMMLDYFCDTQYCSQYLLFPEGTDYCDSSKKKSDSFANKNNLQKYEYLLHPRTTGFKSIMDHLQTRSAVDAVYDVTIAYPDKIPLGGELDILGGAGLPHEVHFHVKRYPISSFSPDTDFGEWCVELWKDKEVQLEKYYTEDRTFKSEGNNRHVDAKYELAKEYSALLLALLYWVIFISFMICTMVYTSITWWHMLFCGTFFLLVDVFYGGLEKLTVDAYHWHRGRVQGVGS